MNKKNLKYNVTAKAAETLISVHNCSPTLCWQLLHSNLSRKILCDNVVMASS